MTERECISGDPQVRPDGGQTTIETDFAGRSPAVAIVTAIADHEGTEPTQLGFTLDEYINGDALERLVTKGAGRQQPEGGLEISLHLDRYLVRVRNDESIAIDVPTSTPSD